MKEKKEHRNNVIFLIIVVNFSFILISVIIDFFWIDDDYIRLNSIYSSAFNNGTKIEILDENSSNHTVIDDADMVDQFIKDIKNLKMRKVAEIKDIDGKNYEIHIEGKKYTTYHHARLRIRDHYILGEEGSNRVYIIKDDINIEKIILEYVE